MMQLPAFLSQKDNTLIYNQDGEFLFYIPESYFGAVKQNPIAQMVGYYVVTVGICDWATVDKNGKVSEAHPFKFPTIFMCKPSSIEKVKDLKLNNYKARDYRILHFKKGDEVISDINVPQIIDNVESIFKMMVITGEKIPPSVPYDKFHDYFQESMKLNNGGSGYGINMQLFGMLASEVCRNPNDLSEPFRYTNMDNMNAYQQVSVKNVPKYISPYVAMTSENWDESLMAAVLLGDKDARYSPLEKIVTA